MEVIQLFPVKTLNVSCNLKMRQKTMEILINYLLTDKQKNQNLQEAVLSPLVFSVFVSCWFGVFF